MHRCRLDPGMAGNRPLRTVGLCVGLAVLVCLPMPAVAHGPGERLHPEERARLRHELRMRSVDARAEHPEGGHRLSPEEKREIRLAIREERRRRFFGNPDGEPRP